MLEQRYFAPERCDLFVARVDRHVHGEACRWFRCLNTKHVRPQAEIRSPLKSTTTCRFLLLPMQNAARSGRQAAQESGRSLHIRLAAPACAQSDILTIRSSAACGFPAIGAIAQ